MLACATSSVAAGDAGLTAARDRNPSLNAYSFHVDVAMRMQTFPWLRFHLEGVGNYERGRSYTIQFTRMPFFVRDLKSIDLSPLDPTMWHNHFAVSIGPQAPGAKTFILHPRKVDPTDKNPLVAAQVTLDANDATRNVVLQYTSGEIQMTLNPSELQGYQLPASSDVNINMPGRSLVAHADFSDYAIRRGRGPGWIAERH